MGCLPLSAYFFNHPLDFWKSDLVRMRIGTCSKTSPCIYLPQFVDVVDKSPCRSFPSLSLSSESHSTLTLVKGVGPPL